MASWSKTAAFATLAIMTVTPAVQTVIGTEQPGGSGRRSATAPVRADVVAFAGATLAPAVPDYASELRDPRMIQQSFAVLASVNPGALPETAPAQPVAVLKPVEPPRPTIGPVASADKPAEKTVSAEASAPTRGPRAVMEAPTASDKLSRAELEALVRKEAARRGMPAELAFAVIKVNSGWNQAKKGGDGEIGLMQVIPRIARQFGFKGDNEALWDPATNVRWGMAYVGGAYRKAGGDLCRTAMKISGGHYVEEMTAYHQSYCNELKAALGADGIANLPAAKTASATPAPAQAQPQAAVPAP